MAAAHGHAPVCRARLNTHGLRVGRAYPRRDQRRCGGGKPSPYNGTVVDGFGRSFCLRAVASDVI
jgi:hypothetical protein